MARGRADDEAGALDAALQAGRKALSFVSGETLDSYLANEQLRFAIERLLHMYGEALKDVSKATLTAIDPNIEWKGSIRFRDLSAHWYVQGLDHELIWETVQVELPREAAAIENYLSRNKPA